MIKLLVVSEGLYGIILLQKENCIGGFMKRIQLSDHFKMSTLLLFSLPSIGMQIVDNTYQIADGYFISNYIGERAFEAEN